MKRWAVFVFLLLILPCLADAKLTLIGSYDTPNFANGVAVSGSYAYVADGYSGLRIIDISNPAGPMEVGSYDTPSFSYDAEVSGGYAYVADAYSGLRIIDISNPASPMEVGSYDTEDAWSVAISGSYAYVADNASGLRIIDISNPAIPMEVGFYDTPGNSYGVTVSGSYAYLADGNFGLRIIDISNPANPIEVGFYDTLSIAYGVAVSGSYAYVADATDGLRIIDISNPATPMEIGFYDTDYAQEVAVSGSYAYVADYGSGLRVINISNPITPMEVGSYDTPSISFDVAVSGSYVYVADYFSGLLILADVILNEDLSVSKVAQVNGIDVQQINPGQNFNYNITVINKDLANDASRVVVTDKLPYNVEYIGTEVYPATPLDYSINQSGDLIYVKFDQIPSGSTRYINITVRAPTQGPTTLYNIVNIRYRNDQNLSDNRMTLATYVPQLGYNQTEAAFSFEDLLHNQSQLLFQFEDLLHSIPSNSSTNYSFLVSFEQLLRSQAALTSSFEDLLSNESSTGWDGEYSEENRTALLWSYEQMLYDEAFLFASFNAKIDESWMSLCNYTAEGHSQDSQTELIASFEDLLKRQTKLYKSFNLLLNKIDIASPQDMIDFLAAYENLLRVEANLLKSFNELLVKKYEKSCSACVCPQGCEYASIQAAIDAASPGDTICVAEGTYNEDVVIDKSVNIMGAGADKTIVTGLGLSGSVFTVGKINPDIKVTLSNIKIIEGQAAGGGGIHNSGTLTIDGCSITDNSVTEHGGGIWNGGFNKLTVKDSVISDNKAGIYGGGIHNNGPMSVEHCTLSNNAAGLIYGGHGGGISNAYDFAYITDSVISGNSAQVGGGITDYYGGTVTIAGCNITGNNGGGISIWDFGGYVGVVKFITSTGTELIWPSYDPLQLHSNNPPP